MDGQNDRISIGIQPVLEELDVEPRFIIDAYCDGEAIGGSKVRRRSVSIITVILMVFTLSACGNKAKPEEPITKYFAAAQRLDSQAMAAVVSPANEKYPNVAVELMAQVLADYLKSAAAKMTYQITGSEITGTNAVVSVDVRYIDVGPFMEEVFREMSARSGLLTASGQASDVPYENY